jgi:HAD superfamily hydrolase (TIGR01509 family)
MATAIVMPQVGQDIKTGVIVEWCVKEGDRIEKGDIVAVVESDKATFEVEAYESGILLKILHDAGAEVPVLDPIAYLGEPGRVGLKAVIFDCDGVLADTERDGHRVAFNRAFAEKGLSIEWDVSLYGELLKIAGGKERMRHYFDTSGWPDGVDDRDAFIKELHKLKTDIYMKLIESAELPLRPGVASLVDEAIAENVKLAVCSTSNEKAVNLVVERLLGLERKAKFDLLLAGDVVSKKKPDPQIYNLALERLGLKPSECVVIEDSRNGLLAAKAAGICCVVTTNGYTEDEEFTEADLVVSELGDPPNVRVTLETIREIVKIC